jgi:Magnesium transporter NIPA
LSLPQCLYDLVYSAILASYLLDEELGHLGRLGCTICILGSLIIVIHAPADKDIETVDEILRYAVQPGTLPPSPSLRFATLLNERRRLPVVLLLRGRLHAHNDLCYRTQIWPFKSTCIYLHMLCCRLCLYHGNQGLRHCREAHPWRQ